MGNREQQEFISGKFVRFSSKNVFFGSIWWFSVSSWYFHSFIMKRLVRQFRKPRKDYEKTKKKLQLPENHQKGTNFQLL